MGLDWDDVRFESGEILVRHAKTGENQRVPMIDELKSILEDDKTRGRVVKLHPDTVTHYFKQAMKKAGIHRDGAVHILRHSLGAELIGPLDVREVQEILRHSQISTTQLYTQVAKEKLREKMQKHLGRKP